MATDTAKYKYNYSMLRVKNPQASVKFYEFLGLEIIKKVFHSEENFDIYTLAYNFPESRSFERHCTDRQGGLQLKYQHGSETDESFKVHNGNSDPGKGFGHVCISVDNIQAACQRIEDAGYRFKKKLSDGHMRYIAFILDPDDYWVEIIGQKPLEQTENLRESNLRTYRFNHTMIRIKDQKVSLHFYQNILGMTLLYTVENASNGFNLYFLGYPPESNNIPPGDLSSIAAYEGLLELTWNYGTEKDPNFAYHHGNTEPLGFGHICISVDNLAAACTRLDSHGVTWLEKQSIGKEGAYFITDPDQYRIKVLPPLAGILNANVLLTIFTLETTTSFTSQMLTLDRQIVQNEALKRSGN